MDNKLPPSTTQEIIDNLSLHDKKLASSPAARQDPQERAKRTLLIAKIVKIVVLAITVLAFARIPYVGSYLDGLVDYLLGFGKYLFYSWLIFLLIGLLFNTPYSQIIRTKRFIIFSLVALLSACCVVSGVTGLIKSTDGNKESFLQMVNGYNSS
ncbi:MAG: hypothetical protein MJ223_01270 [Mycoplasmoidaceae bacterium]|nr:hypothetical protein [Mycoplasmoidaceae bacterium]